MKTKSIKTGDLSAQLGCRIDGDPDIVLTGISTIEEATPDQLTFLANPRYKKFLSTCGAGAIIISDDEEVVPGLTRIISSNPYLDFRKALKIIYETDQSEPFEGISKLAVIDESAVIGEDVSIAPFVVISKNTLIGNGSVIEHSVYIGANSKIGNNCTIGRGVIIRQEIEIGDRVVIGDGSVIGFDGFGYAPEEGGFSKIPQIGTVVIEDEVEIGANCCIDRATVGVTRIGKGSKLDNLIQVAHGVKIGSNTVIAAQTGISGSTRIGSNVLMGGQVGIVGHAEIGNGMIIGAQAGVTKSVDIKGVISGYPARPHKEALRRDANVSLIPKLLKRIKELERKIDSIPHRSAGGI